MTVTVKQTKIIGETELYDKRTGNIIPAQVIEMKDSDFNFEKIWLAHILNALDMIGNKKLKVVQWILNNKNAENVVIITQRKLAKEVGVGLNTVSKTLLSLVEADFIIKINSGAYRVNPDVIFKGRHNKRMAVLNIYSSEKNEQKSLFENQAIEEPPRKVEPKPEITSPKNKRGRPRKVKLEV